MAELEPSVVKPILNTNVETIKTPMFIKISYQMKILVFITPNSLLDDSIGFETIIIDFE